MRIAILNAAIIILALTKVSFSQNPTYTLDVNDGNLVAPNIFEFDIDQTWTNTGVAPNYEMAGGQFFFDINGAIANGGTMTMQNAGSDLPVNIQPRNPTVYTVTTPWMLRWAVNTFPGAGNGFQMPAGVPIKIVRVRLITTANRFAQIPLQLSWRLALPTPFTKIFAYVGTTNTDITTPNTHSISLSGFFLTLPYVVTVKAGIEGLMKNGQHVISDSVLILIRNATAPYHLIDSSFVVLNADSLSGSFTTTVTPGNYYIVVKHKNGMETWSKPGGEPLGNGNYFYDFTSSASQAYGNNLVLKDGLYCIYSGNVNGDDVIDAEDLLAVDNAVFNYAPGTHIANLNGDNIVDIEDMAICDNNARAIRVVERPVSLELFKIGTSKLKQFFEKN
jgi:hypothetical protein